MKGLKKCIQISEISEQPLRKEIRNYLWSFRATTHPSTGFSPAELMFNGRRFLTRLPNKYYEQTPQRDQVEANELTMK